MENNICYSEDLFYALEEINVLSKYKDDPKSFKEKLKELNFDNLEVSFEDVIHNFGDIVITIIKKIIEYLKKVYNFIFGYARRTKLQISILQKKFNKLAPLLKEHFGKVEINNTPSATTFENSTKYIDRLFVHIDYVLKNSKCTSNNISVVALDPEKVTEHFYNVSEKTFKTNKQTVKYNFYTLKTSLMEDVLKEDVSKESKTFDTLGYNKQSIAFLFKVAMDKCDIVTKRKANIEYLISGLSAITLKFKSDKLEMPDNDYSTVAALESNISLLKAALSGTSYFFGHWVTWFSNIVKEINSFYKTNKDSLK